MNLNLKYLSFVCCKHTDVGYHPLTDALLRTNTLKHLMLFTTSCPSARYIEGIMSLPLHSLNFNGSLSAINTQERDEIYKVISEKISKHKTITSLSLRNNGVSVQEASVIIKNLEGNLVMKELCIINNDKYKLNKLSSSLIHTFLERNT